jgi:hypothetical protein
MADLTVSQNDKGFYLSFTITDSAGTAYNLTGYTITLKVWEEGATGVTSLIVNGVCEIVVAASGTCRYLLTSTSFTAVNNNYIAELELTKSGVIESTERFTIEVKESA